MSTKGLACQGGSPPCRPVNYASGYDDCLANFILQKRTVHVANFSTNTIPCVEQFINQTY